jgi:hypothetical protein
MHDTASFEIKALLTLALLKSGTSAKDIQTAVNVASAARLMIIEEFAELAREEAGLDSNITSLHDVRHNATAGHKSEPQSEGLNPDIKALLSLLLLQHGATPKEIRTTLRLAAAARGAESEETMPERIAAPANNAAATKEADKRQSPKQTMRNEFLAPIPKTARAA